MSASLDRRKPLRLYNLKTQQCEHSYNETATPSDLIFSLCSLSNDGFVTGHLYGGIKVWNRVQKSTLQDTEENFPYDVACTMIGHRFFVMSLCQLKDGRLVSSSNCIGDKHLNVWSLDTGSSQKIDNVCMIFYNSVMYEEKLSLIYLFFK